MAAFTLVFPTESFKGRAALVGRWSMGSLESDTTEHTHAYSFCKHKSTSHVVLSWSRQNHMQ